MLTVHFQTLDLRGDGHANWSHFDIWQGGVDLTGEVTGRLHSTPLDWSWNTAHKMILGVTHKAQQKLIEFRLEALVKLCYWCRAESVNFAGLLLEHSEWC